MVLHKYGERLYKGVEGALRGHLAGVASHIEATQGMPFLKELKARWDDHNKSTQMIRDILMVGTTLMCGSSTACDRRWQQCAQLRD
jgi:cullin 3